MSTKLRYTEYYDMQHTLDLLYDRSKCGNTKGIDLYNIITSERNILLAYRILKSNKGSNTCGVDGRTIQNYKIKDEKSFVMEIQDCLEKYKPQAVRRKEIPKANGKKRPLGIPTLRDRIIQQMFKQVLEPICEAKFYNHSYGFRPNRSAQHAIARCTFLIARANFHYVVDIDIKSFFDEVNHSKLLKQLYEIGVKDRRVLTLINKMLKAPIQGKGIQNKGVPQGGVLSPLLANVVLNDLDQWIASQWEEFPTRHKYAKGHKTRALKTTNLKEMYIVRYADDFKIFTKTANMAWKIFYGVKGYVERNLSLHISKEKSKVTNLRKRSSEFLGFEIKVIKKKNNFTVKTNVSERNKQRIRREVREKIITIQKDANFKNVKNYNAYILGVQNYYSCASRVNIDFAEIAYSLHFTLFNRLKPISKYERPRSPPKIYEKFYKNNFRTFKIGQTYLFPLNDIKWRLKLGFKQQICDYTSSGREERHKQLNSIVNQEIQKLQMQDSPNRSVEYIDNRISKYSMQKGICAVTGEFLLVPEIHCHHVLPKSLGGTDDFGNLIIVHQWVHTLIHATRDQTVRRYMALLKLNGKQLEKLNRYREKCNLSKII